MTRHDDTVYKRAYHNMRQTLKRLYRWQQRDIKSHQPRPDEDEDKDGTTNTFIDDPVSEGWDDDLE